MNGLIRAGLIVALGLGLNVLCADAWADEDRLAGTEPSDEDRALVLEPQAWVEPIWSLP